MLILLETLAVGERWPVTLYKFVLPQYSSKWNKEFYWISNIFVYRTNLTSPLFLVSLCERFVKRTDGFSSTMQKGTKTPAKDPFLGASDLDDTSSICLTNVVFLSSNKVWGGEFEWRVEWALYSKPAK